MNTKDTHKSTVTSNTTTDYIYNKVLNTFVNKLTKLVLSTFVKVTSFLIPLLKRGNGYTWPGFFILKFFPNVLDIISYKQGIILISGTNGKTTTCKVVTHLLSSLNYSVASNKSGANLLSGVVTAAFLNTDAWGNFTADYGVFEVDEFALPVALKHLSPTGVVLLNLSRDQLDRYGEVDAVVSKWQEALSGITNPYFLVLNKNQPEFNLFEDLPSAKISYFDASPYLLERTDLSGSHNALNVNAAAILLSQLGIDESAFRPYLRGIRAAYGRGELLTFKGKSFRLFLAKNPASFNSNLNMISEKRGSYDCVFMLLNDGIPDGRDVSWIYDIKPENLTKACDGKHVYVSGTRAFDMATRLQYAGVNLKIEDVVANPDKALQKINSSEHSNVLVLPNYSAMLEVRKLLAGRSIL